MEFANWSDDVLALQRTIPQISKQILVNQLRELEEDQIIKRIIYPERSSQKISSSLINDHFRTMRENDIKRLSRLTAILTQLQSKRILTSTELAKRFSVSVRTIYRDIKALEEAGVPILTKDGKGYTLMEGYRIPPVMFTENEANALVTVEQLILKNRDSSLVKEYTTAIGKVKAVLQYGTKEKAELLADRIAVSPLLDQAPGSSSLSLIQQALTSFNVIEINYHSDHKDEQTKRAVEPFALYYSLQESWVLIAYCRLRSDYRMFRLDRILNIKLLGSHFKPHPLTLSEYLEEKRKKFNQP